MELSVLSLLTLTATALALAAKNPPRVKWYFAVQFFSTIGTSTVINIWGWQSNIYRIAYSVATVAILIASWRLVWPGRRRLLIATVNALALFAMACSVLPLVPTVDTVILLTAGVVTIFLGIALALQASDNAAVYGPLSILWLILGGFSMIHAIQPTPFWDNLADWLTYWVGVACFLWIGIGRKICAKSVKSPIVQFAKK